MIGVGEDANQFVGRTIPDLIPARTRLLFVGVNPGLQAVAVRAHFAGHANRFFPALFRAGITDRLIDPSSGYEQGDVEHLLQLGIGITSLVAGATARVADLSDEELRAGVGQLTVRVRRISPVVVAFLGVTAYRIAFANKCAKTGHQPEPLAGSELWIVPNPSGLNRRENVASLAASYREVADAAGVTEHRG